MSHSKSFFPKGDSQVATLLRTKDWSQHPLGPPESWPQELKTTVNLIIHSKIPMWVAWGEQKSYIYNDAQAEITGKKHPSAFGEKLEKVWSENWHVMGPFAEKVYSGESIFLEDFKASIKRFEQVEEAYFTFSFSPLKNDDGEVKGLFCTVIETTEKKIPEEALKQSEQHLRLALRAGHLGVWAIRLPDGELSFDEKTRELHGILPGEDAQDIVNRQVYPEDKDRVEAALEATLKEGALYDIEYRIQHTDGSVHWVYDRGESIRDEQGKLISIQGVVSDITSQKNSQLAASRERERLYGALMEAPVLIGIHRGENLVMEFANSLYRDVFGGADDIIGKPLTEAVPSIQPEVVSIIQKVLQSGEAYHLAEFPIHLDYDHNGKPYKKIWNLTYQPLRGRSGEIESVMTCCFEVTEQVRARNALSESETRFEYIANALPIIIWTAQPDGTVDWYNDWWYTYLGGLRGTTWDDSEVQPMHPEDVVRTKELWPKAVAAGKPFQMEQRFRRGRDGQYRWHQVRGIPILDEHGRVTKYVGGNTDIHDEKLLADELARAKAGLEIERKNFETLFEQSSGFVSIFKGPEFIYEYSNETNNQILGFDPTGKKLKEAVPDVEASGLLARFGNIYRTGIQEITRELPLKIGDKTRYFNATYVAHRDAGGEIDGLMAWGVDVTDQVKARKALEVSEARYREAKLNAEAASATKTAFLANMSHEIRTPLGAIIGFSTLLKDRSIEASERDQYVDTIVRNGNSLTRIIDDILDLAKVEAGRLDVENMPFSLYRLATEAVDLFKDKTKEKDIYLLLNIDDGVPTQICSDPTRLRQILVNLIGNAVKFTEHGGVRVNVKSAPVEGGKTEISVQVKDTGIGLKPEQKDRLFQPFTQADNSMTRKFGGTGLGLALSQRLSQALNGEISIVECGIGEGCTFLLKFLADLPSQNALADHHKEKGFKLDGVCLDGLNVLVVDDSPDNQFLVVRLLSKNGAHVDVASDGEEGYMKALTGSYDVVLMDIQMPTMDGYHAKEALDIRGYRGPVIALTAHAMADERTKTRAAGFAGHLTKPLIAKELLKTVASFKKAPQRRVNDAVAPL